jgi:hypothetical protein
MWRGSGLETGTAARSFNQEMTMRRHLHPVPTPTGPPAQERRWDPAGYHAGAILAEAARLAAQHGLVPSCEGTWFCTSINTARALGALGSDINPLCVYCLLSEARETYLDAVYPALASPSPLRASATARAFGLVENYQYGALLVEPPTSPALGRQILQTLAEAAFTASLPAGVSVLPTTPSFN